MSTSQTPRRNPRRAATNTPSVVSSVVSRQTRRPNPTPSRREVATRQSTAYGGRGARYAAAPERVRASGADEGFAELETRRQESSEESTPAVETASSSSAPSSPSRPSSPAVSEAATPGGAAASSVDVRSRPLAGQDTSISFGPRHEAGIAAYGDEEEEEEEEEGVASARPIFFGRNIFADTTTGEAGWFFLVLEFLTRIFNCAKSGANAVVALVFLIWATMWLVKFAGQWPLGERLAPSLPTAWLSQQLPNVVMLNTNAAGELIIPPDLWTAIETVRRESPHSEHIEIFTKQNEAKLHEFIDQHIGTNLLEKHAKSLELLTDERILRSFESSGLVTKDKLIDMLNEQFSAFKQQHADAISSATSQIRNEISPQIHSLVSSMQKDLLKALPRSSFDQFVASRALAAAELSLTKINFFSGALGARINPKFTSPTVSHHTNSVSKFWSSILGTMQEPHKAIKVLTPWVEAAQAWCAAPSKNIFGRASVGISASHDIWPKSFTIEHVPRAATPDITSAPKWVELWAEVHNPAVRDRMLDNQVQDPVRRCQAGSDLPDTYVCLGRRFYDIHGILHVQSWELDQDLQHYSQLEGEEYGTNNFVLKVTSNWGGDRTCLYRVRVHGEVVAGLPTPTQPEDD